MSDNDSQDDYKKRVKYLKRYDPLEFEDTFLEVLANNPDLLRDLISAANFHANMHDIHDECPSGEQHCDNCYSGDTEHDNNSRLKTTLKKLWIDTYDLTYVYSDGDEASDGEDEYHDGVLVKRGNSEKNYFHDENNNSNDEDEDKKEEEAIKEIDTKAKEETDKKGKEEIDTKGKEEVTKSEIVSVENSNNQ